MSSPVRTAIVTGAASGLGRSLAVRLAKDGWKLALADIDTRRAEVTQALVEKAGGSAQVEELDVSDPVAWCELVGRLRSDWPQLDLLVNNAGVCGAGDVGEFPLDDWQWLLGINLHGVIYGCHTCLPWLKQNSNGAHIINTASVAGFLAAPTMGAYNVAKAGVLALSETMYAELAPQNIGVTVVCPGFFQSDLLDKGRFMQEFGRKLAADYMKKSNFTADHVADVAVRAMYRKKFYVIEGRRARWLWRVKRSMPLGFLRLVASGWKRTQDQQKARQGNHKSKGTSRTK